MRRFVQVAATLSLATQASASGPPKEEREVAQPPVVQAAAQALQVVPAGHKEVRAPASNFTGVVRSSARFAGTGGSRMGGATVTFEAGARTNWHSHPLGQLLVVTAGHGWVQADGEPVRAIRSGDTIWTAPGVKHWHGASRTSGMTHVGISETKAGATVQWQEPVTDAQYHGPD